MNISFFIAKNIVFRRTADKRISRPIIFFNIIGIALSFVIMFISISVVIGFKKVVYEKVSGFASDITITHYDSNYSFETTPITINKNDIYSICSIPAVKNIQLFATKPGIIKSKNTLYGVVLKGVYREYNWDFIKKHLIAGNILTFPDTTKSDQILLSSKISQQLQLKIGDPVFLYFIQNPPRMRKFVVCGIFETMFEDFDNMFAFVDLRHIQKLNDWKINQISGYEINVHNFDSIEQVKQKIFSIVGASFQKDGSKLKVASIKDRYPYIFDWIGLFNTNLWVILLLMSLVAGFNVISGLLVIVLERIYMIGLFKAIGFKNNDLRNIFIFISFSFVLVGLILGNIVSFGIYFVQNKFHLFHLDKTSYYIDYVPMSIDFWNILLLNIAVLVITYLFLILPSQLISRIEPIKAIKFE